MGTFKRIAYDDLDLKIEWGNLLIDVQYIRYTPPRSGHIVKYHCHSSYELHFIPNGHGTLVSEGDTYDIRPNTFFLTGPYIYHEQISDENDAMAEYCINFDILWSDKKESTLSFPSQGEIDELTQILLNTRFWFGEDTYGSMELFRKIFQELDQHLVGVYSNIRNYVTQLIINTVRCYSNHRKALYTLPKKSLNEMRAQVISKFFLNDRNLSPTLETIAGKLGLSQRQTSRIIRQHYQTSFKKKHIADKMKHAKMLLLTTDLSVKDVADRAGFASASYFHRTFKEREGASPMQFRAAQRSSQEES